MTRDDIIKLAREAGYFLYDLTETHGKRTVETDADDEWAVLERFAALVAAAEREACAKVCENEGARTDASWASCAAAIRARGASMTTLRTAAQQALEALEYINKYGFVLADYEGPMEQAITALKAALEQPVQPPCDIAEDGVCEALECCKRGQP